MKRLLTRAAAAFVLGVYCFCTTMPALAATSCTSTTATPNNSGQALEIAPPVVTISVNPGQSVKTQLFLRDVSQSNLVVTSEVDDFVAAGEDGTPKILLKDEGANPYSLKAWVVPPVQLQLASREVKTLPITINVPANATPGGHYGIVRFTAAAPSLNGNTGVSLSASLGALLLVTVSGKTKESLNVKEFSANKGGKTSSLFESTPINFTLRLRNDGNVHEQPTAQAIIKDMFGKTVAAVNFNEPPHNILPQSIRRFDAPLDKATIGTKKLFGHYTAHLTVTYGATKQVTTATMGFWVIPYRLIGILILVLIGGFFLLRYFIKRYNRMIVSKATNNSKKK